MTDAVRAVSVAVTMLLLGGAVAIGGGTPLSPAQIAAATRQAAKNSDAAAANTEQAARDTRALARITENVQSQVDSSRMLLRTQLKLQQSSKEGAREAEAIARGIEQVRRALAGVSDELAELVSFSYDAAASADESSASGARLADRLRILRARFDEVTKQSRRLNRKARGYDEVRDGPR